MAWLLHNCDVARAVWVCRRLFRPQCQCDLSNGKHASLNGRSL